MANKDPNNDWRDVLRRKPAKGKNPLRIVDGGKANEPTEETTDKAAELPRRSFLGRGTKTVGAIVLGLLGLEAGGLYLSCRKQDEANKEEAERINCGLNNIPTPANNKSAQTIINQYYNGKHKKSEFTKFVRGLSEIDYASKDIQALVLGTVLVFGIREGDEGLIANVMAHSTAARHIRFSADANDNHLLDLRGVLEATQQPGRIQNILHVTWDNDQIASLMEKIAAKTREAERQRSAQEKTP